MRILIYNWADGFVPTPEGGGVTVYQRNVVETLLMSTEHEVHTLSSGTHYDLWPNANPRWEEQPGLPAFARLKRFRIVNSAVLAPAHADFGAEAQLHDQDTRDCFFDFLLRNGPYDAVHFNNLEGLPASVLKLKKVSPQTKLIFSLHNYYPFCPQVNLWRQESENCTDFKGGSRCQNCVSRVASPPTRKLIYACADRIGKKPAGHIVRSMRAVQKTGQKLATKNLRDADPLSNFGNSTAASAFAMRRRCMSEYLNANCDHVLCVSEAVKKTAVRYGVSQKLAVVSYIGTRAARLYQEGRSPPHALDDEGALRIAFLGYMRRDKGFHFLLEALERLPSLNAGRIKLVVAAKRGDAKLGARLKRLELTLAEVKVWDGYRPEQLDRILDGVALGVVPVLWQDNLPQVAIEMHSRRIPLLTSDLGGAKELSNRSDLVFCAGDHDEFAARLESIITGKITFEDYWSRARIPSDMDAHLEELMRFYAQGEPRHSYASRLETNSQSFQFTEMSGS